MALNMCIWVNSCKTYKQAKALALNLLKEDTKRGLKVFKILIYCFAVRQNYINSGGRVGIAPCWVQT